MATHQQLIDISTPKPQTAEVRHALRVIDCGGILSAKPAHACGHRHTGVCINEP